MPLEDTPYDLGLEKPPRNESSTTGLPAPLARTSVVGASTNRHNALERLAALSTTPKPGDERCWLSPAGRRASCSTSAGMHGTTLELSGDLSPLIQGDDADACG